MALAILVSVGVGFLLVWLLVRRRLDQARGTGEQLVREAREEAERVRREALVQARDVVVHAKAEFEREARDKRQEVQALERRVQQREEHLEKKLEGLERREAEATRREKGLGAQEKAVAEQEGRYRELLQEARLALERAAGLSAAEARRHLLQEVEGEIRLETAKLVKQIEEEAREQADRKAKEIICEAIQRYAGEVVSERTVTVVHLPNDEMKGRIIGREGRNIRAFEALTGIDVIIDDTPEAVVLSGFDPVRREVARLAMERLIADGRIHPARIEEVVAKVQEEIENTIREAGEQAAFEMGVHGIHPELIRLVGRLKYRTSFSQNVYQHSLEVAYLAGIMAGEIGLNVKQAKRAGLLHDIGKAMTHETEGPHALISAELARKHGENEKIVHAIAAHNEDVPPETPLAVVVHAADAISAARPGARRQTLENYVKRLQDLERIASSFPGIEKCFAIQAGREIRIIVERQTVSDEDAAWLAREIARKIERELTYPGQIKVHVIRETRAVEYAR
ncbi:MAG: ribonuclease Y [Deltaproteobacteria bacterium]|nr:ribonuclease Y [Deltaproteobacteria bacterium]